MSWIGRFAAVAVVLLFAGEGSLGAASAAGPEQAPAARSATASQHQPATLVFFNRQIVTFRSDALGYPPADRAEAAKRRLQEMVRRDQVGPVTIAPSGDAYQILVGGKWLLFITPGDADRLAGETPAEVASRTQATLSEALRAAEEQSTIGRFLRGLTAAGIATAVFVLLLIVLRRLRRYLELGLTNVLQALADRRESVRAARPRLQNVIRRLVAVPFLLAVFAATYGWLVYVLERFPYTRPWGESLGRLVIGAVDRAVKVFVADIPGLLAIVAIVIITRWLVRGAGIVFELIETKRLHLPWFHPEVAAPTRRITTALLWVFAVVISYPYIPFSDSAAFRGISVLIGLMVSLGGMGIVNQAMSGLTLMYARAFRPGEYVRIGDIEGTVISLGVLSTRVRTIKCEEMNIPNSVVVSTATKNFSRQAGSEPLLLHTSVTIGYDAPWRQVHALLESAAMRTAGLLPEPAPFVLQRSLSDFYVEYEINAVIERPHDRVQVLSDLHRNIQDLFNEFGVQIMSPHFMTNPAAPVVVPRGKWHAPPADPAGPTLEIRKPDKIGEQRGE